jgi:hypothetical protein
VRIREFPVPRGCRDHADFNAQLAALLRADPSLLPSPLSKSTRGGMQTGELDPDSSPVLGAFRDALNAELRAVIAELKQEGFAGHPVMDWASDRWTADLGHGAHTRRSPVPHLHPLAWLSGVYVEVPPLGNDGALEFDEPAPDRARVPPAPDQRPPGRLVVFLSGSGTDLAVAQAASGSAWPST